MLDVMLMHILDGILMDILDVLIRMHTLGVLLLLQEPAGAWRRRLDTWSEPEAEDLRNHRYTSYNAFGIALGFKDGTKCH